MFNNIKIKKIATICTVAIILLICVVFGTYKYNKVHAYNNLITTANKDMDNQEYDQAIALFQQSLKYKNDPMVQKNIELANKLKSVKSTYDEGMKLMNDKKYSDAIDQFNKITKDDDKLYTEAQKNIANCKKQYIAEELASAKKSAGSGNYSDAINYLDSILKVDSNNADAKKLKNVYSESTQGSNDKSTKNSSSTQKISQQSNTDDDYTPEEAIQLARQYYFKEENMPPTDDLGGNFWDWQYKNGKKYGMVHLYSKACQADGGTGTAENVWIAKDGSTTY